MKRSSNEKKQTDGPVLYTDRYGLGMPGLSFRCEMTVYELVHFTRFYSIVFRATRASSIEE
jgi:hypothetical protein